MIIEIEDELFNKVLQIVKSRNSTIYNKLQKIKPINAPLNDTLINAREIKTNRVKERIKKAIEELKSEDITITKYQLHKKTKIAYVTLNKYYDDILEELKDD